MSNKYLIIFPIISLISFLTLIFVPFYISIKLNRKNQYDNIKIRIILLKGFVNMDLEIPFIDIVKYGNQISVQLEQKLEKGKKEKDIFESLKIISLREIIDKYKQFIEEKIFFITISKYIQNKLEIKKVSWETKIGTGDAALTGIITGFFWSLKNILLSFISSRNKIGNIKINVTPDFNKTIFETEFYCIIKLKLVYIIIGGFKGIKAKIKGGGLYV